MAKVERRTVDLTEFPNLVVIYLGMRAQSPRGLWKLFQLGPQIQRSVQEKPAGLLRHESILYSLWPLHLGMRQYWRDFAALETWVRAMPHQAWWKDFLRKPGGVGFWHEVYTNGGAMEAIFDDVHAPIGLSAFAPVVAAQGPMFAARARLGLAGEAPPAPVPESLAGE